MSETTQKLQLAVIADLHCDIMHDAARRLDIFLAAAAEWEVDGILQLGDFCTPRSENRHFSERLMATGIPCHHLIGNHDLDGGYPVSDVLAFHSMPGSYYSFDLSGVHCIVLDSNDLPPGSNVRSGYIGDQQLEWLETDLAAASAPVLLFSHQSLELPVCIGNQDATRKIVTGARRSDGTRKVIACVNGHTHIDHARVIDGIPFIHINSASYYWLGDSGFALERFTPDVHAAYPQLCNAAPYENPLFTLLEVDLSAKSLSLLPAATRWIGPSPQEMGQSYPGIDPAWVTPQISARSFSFDT